MITSRTVVPYGVIGALTFAQACTADTLEVDWPAEVPRQNRRVHSARVTRLPSGWRPLFDFFGLPAVCPLDEPTAFGFSGRNVLDLFNAKAHGALRWVDGSSTDIALHCTWSGADVSYDEVPNDGTYCTPNVRVPLSELQILSGDSGIDARYLPTERSGSLDLLASTDGHGGIGLIFVSQLRIDIEQVSSPLLDEMVALNPEHDSHHVGVEMSLSSTGAKSTCIKGEVISEAPEDDCNIFDGVLRFHSFATAGLSNHHNNIPEGTYYDAPLATWLWTF